MTTSEGSRTRTPRFSHEAQKKQTATYSRVIMSIEKVVAKVPSTGKLSLPRSYPALLAITLSPRLPRPGRNHHRQKCHLFENDSDRGDSGLKSGWHLGANQAQTTPTTSVLQVSCPERLCKSTIDGPKETPIWKFTSFHIQLIPVLPRSIRQARVSFALPSSRMVGSSAGSGCTSTSNSRNTEIDVVVGAGPLEPLPLP